MYLNDYTCFSHYTELIVGSYRWSFEITLFCRYRLVPQMLPPDLQSKDLNDMLRSRGIYHERTFATMSKEVRLRKEKRKEIAAKMARSQVCQKSDFLQNN
jgi:hypothetical protein